MTARSRCLQEERSSRLDWTQMCFVCGVKGPGHFHHLESQYLKICQSVLNTLLFSATSPFLVLPSQPGMSLAGMQGHTMTCVCTYVCACTHARLPSTLGLLTVYDIQRRVGGTFSLRSVSGRCVRPCQA